MDLFLLCLYLLGLYYLGSCALILSQPHNQPHLKWLDYAIFSFPLGIGLVTIPFFVANQFLNLPFTRISILAITGGLVFVATGLCRKYSSYENLSRRFPSPKHLSQGFRAVWKNTSEISMVGKYASILIALSLAVGGSLVLFFPMQTADVYIYHLPIAKIIFDTGYLPVTTSPSFVEAENAYPPLVFVYYGANWLVYGAIEYIIPKMSSFLFGVLLLGVVYRIVRTLLDSSVTAGLLSILFTIEIQSFKAQLLQENIDFPFSFYCLASFYFVLRGFRYQNTRELILGSVFSVMACWSKYHGLVFVGIFSALLLGWSIYKHYLLKDYIHDKFPPSKILKLFWLPCALLFLPLLIRNTIRWGNPVYPAFQQIIGGHLIDEWSLLWVSSPYLPSGLFYDIHDTGLRLLVMAFLPFLFLAAYSAFRSRNHLGIFAFILFAAFIVCGAAIMPLKGNGESTRYLFSSLLIGTAYSGTVLFDRFISSPQKNLYGSLFICLWLIMLFYIQGPTWPNWDYFATPTTSLFKSLNRIFLFTTDKIVFLTPFLLSILFLGGGLLAKFQPEIDTRLKTIWAILLLSLIILPSHQAQYKGIIATIKQNPVWINAPFNPNQKQWPWMVDHIPDDAVVLTFDPRVFNIPGRAFPADTPVLRDFFDTGNLEFAVSELEKHGITHIYIGCINEGFQPLYHRSVVFQNLDDTRYFNRIYYNDQDTGVYPVTKFSILNTEGYEESGYQLLPRRIAVYEIQKDITEIKKDITDR